MTHDIEQHVHDGDPPSSHPASPWNDALIQRITELWKVHSATEISLVLKAELDINFTRNQVVGKLYRLGLTNAHKRKPGAEHVKIISAPRAKRERKSVIRIVASNGNSNSQRIFKSISAGPLSLRCVEVDPRHLTLDQLEPDQCRYPFGEGPFTFCGHPVFSQTYAEGTGTIVTRKSSYCGPHAALTTELPRKQRVENAA